jgi:DNA-directed RNA polymerase subunit RPC12/RpoP
VVHYRCPSCRIPLESKDSEAGRKVQCPTCGQRMEVPWPSKKAALADRDDDEPVRPRRRGYDDEDDRPRRSRDDDEDYDVRPTRRRLRRTCECPNCGHVGEPYERKEMAQEGWIVLVVLLLVFFPLFFIGLLMKQTYLVCWECGYKIRKVGGVTFG